VYPISGAGSELFAGSICERGSDSPSIRVIRPANAVFLHQNGIRKIGT